MVSIEFTSIDAGTRVLMTKQIANLDGGDSSEERREGLGEVFDRLEAEV